MSTDQAFVSALSAADHRPAVVQEHRSPWLQLLQLRTFDWTHATLPVPSANPALAALRMVHLSDIHMRCQWEPAFDQLHSELSADPPDLIFLTGDMVDDKHDHRPAMPQVERFIAGLSARRGIFAILGNHDSPAVGEELRKLGVHVISSQQHILPVGSGALELIGAPGYRREHFHSDFARRFSAPEDGRPRLILAHFPDHILRTRELCADVYFAGHTHGGQVCLPNGAPLIRHDTLPRHQCKGIHRIDRTWLVVSRGLGFSGTRIRMFCPAEVAEIRLAPSLLATDEHR